MGKKRMPELATWKDVWHRGFRLARMSVCVVYLLVNTVLYDGSMFKSQIFRQWFSTGPTQWFYIDGPVMDSSEYSFIGLHPVLGFMDDHRGICQNDQWGRMAEGQDEFVIYSNPLENYTHMTRYQLPGKSFSQPEKHGCCFIYIHRFVCLRNNYRCRRGTPNSFEVFGHPDFKGAPISLHLCHQRVLQALVMQKGLCGVDLQDFYKPIPMQLERIIFRGYLSWLIKQWELYPHFF